MSYAIVAVGVSAGVGMISSSMSQAQAKEQQYKALSAEKLGAQYSYTATEDSVNIMKAVSREQSNNAIYEVARAGAANDRTVQQQVEVEAGKVASTNEGLTSGRSKGREMLHVYMKGNKITQQMKAKSRSMINDINDKQEQQVNELNNKQLQAYNMLSAILADRGSYDFSEIAVINAGIQGGMQAYGAVK